jgi:hypothetical protein
MPSTIYWRNIHFWHDENKAGVHKLMQTLKPYLFYVDTDHGYISGTDISFGEWGMQYHK